MEKSISTPELDALKQVLRQIRLAAHLRQEDLAEVLGEPQSFVSKYETGERRLDFIELRKICEALGVTMLDFVKRFEEQLRSCNPTKTS